MSAPDTSMPQSIDPPTDIATPREGTISGYPTYDPAPDRVTPTILEWVRQ